MRLLLISGVGQDKLVYAVLGRQSVLDRMVTRVLGEDTGQYRGGANTVYRDHLVMTRHQAVSRVL